jgi:hypothetical protein
MKLIVIVGLFVATAVGACLFLYHRHEVAAGEKAALLAHQSEKLASLKTEQERLSRLAAGSNNVSEPSVAHEAEIAKLRAQADALRERTNRIAREKKAAAPGSSTPNRAPEPHPAEYYEELHKATGTKPIEARDIALAASMYAADHANQAPTNMDQVATYLEKSGRAKPTTNRFELVFTGSLDQLQGIPRSSIAIVRDTHTLQAPDGKQIRVYGMMGGVGQIVTSDDNFKSWEAEHVISAPSPK